MTILDAPAAGILDVVAVSDTEWTVCDSRIAAGDDAREFARIERTPHYVLVMWNAPSAGWAAFATLEDAKRALERSRTDSILAA